MRVRWMLGVLAVVTGAGGCAFDPTRSCSTAADCKNGARCDAATKTCVAVGDPNDKTAPVFSLRIADPPARTDTAVLKSSDPGVSGGVAFRRDEAATVAVESDATDVDAASVTLAVTGMSALNPPSPQQLGPCPASMKAFCRQALVSFAPPLPFDTFRGAVTLNVEGKDVSGNAASASATVQLTRWKWSYASGAPILSSPALADDGTLLFGTNGAGGKLFALTPDGQERWAPQSLGPIAASLAVGAAGSQQLVYAGTNATPSFLLARDVATGADAGTCGGMSSGGGSGYSTPFAGSLAVGTSIGLTAAVLESVVGIASGSRLVTLRPGGISDDVCLGTPLPSNVTIGPLGGPSLSTDSSALFVGGTGGLLYPFVFEVALWKPVSSWNGGAGVAALGGAEAVPPVPLPGGQLESVSGAKGLLKIDAGTGAITQSPSGTYPSDTGGLALGSAGAYFGRGPDVAPRLVRVANFLDSAPTTVVTDGRISAAPVLGSDTAVYTVSSIGALQAWTSSLGSIWAARLSAANSAITASPTLDCSRDAGTPITGPGVLYAADRTGTVYAVVVDSAGLDPAAPWPKYQHDVRNTGNPSTPVPSCP